MKRIEGRIAVVTGAASGIGRATALRLAERGCALALADVDSTGLEETARQIAPFGTKLMTARVDVSSASEVESFARQVETFHGGAHILINNAGVVIAGPFAEQRLEDLEWLVGINYWGVVYGCHHFLPLLRRQDEGHIVNLSSLFGLLGLPQQSGYCATKAAVRALSESLYAELRADRIGVSTIHPGCIDTSIVRSGRMEDPSMRQRVEALFARRGAPPDVVARAILRAIERDKLFVRVRPETIAADWAKRLFPSAIHRLLARGSERDAAQGHD